MKFNMDTELGDGAKINLIVDLGAPSLDKADGQVKVNVPKDHETRYKILNIRYDYRLSRILKEFTIRLVEAIESNEKRSA